MTAPALDIRGSGASWVITRGRETVGGPYAGHHLAVAALRGVERRLTPSRVIPCLNCGAPIRSLSKGHRLCPSCRGA